MKQQRAKPREDGLQTVFDFYAQPGAMTGPGRHAQALAKLPNDVSALAEVIQGLAIHQYMAEAYGFKVPRSSARRIPHPRRRPDPGPDPDGR